MTMEKAIEIGIEKITTVKKLAEFIKTAENKEDILYIFEKMETVLVEGITEIEHIQKNID